MINRDVNRAEISGPPGPQNFFCSARPGINILQNLYNNLNMLGVAKTHENFVKYGYNL